MCRVVIDVNVLLLPQAIDRANEALSSWKDGTTASHRSNLLYKWSELIKKNSEDICECETQ